MGAALGAETDPAWTGPASEVAETSRLALRASARTGVRIPVSERVDVLGGGGLGVTWASASRSLATDDEDVQQGGFFVEAHADAAYRLSPRLSLLGGVAGRGSFLSTRAKQDATEAAMPDPLPALTGELRIGAGWDFGGSP
jgi:hypothetical protein